MSPQRNSSLYVVSGTRDAESISPCWEMELWPPTKWSLASSVCVCVRMPLPLTCVCVACKGECVCTCHHTHTLCVRGLMPHHRGTVYTQPVQHPYNTHVCCIMCLHVPTNIHMQVAGVVTHLCACAVAHILTRHSYNDVHYIHSACCLLWHALLLPLSPIYLH